MKVTVMRAEELPTDQLDAWGELLHMAGQDPYLDNGDGSLRSAHQRMAILHDGVVGFFSPFQQCHQGRDYWRAGPLYLMQGMRGQGIMRQALQEFFASHTPGLTWIDDTNEASIRLFTFLGFVKQGPQRAQNGGMGSWYVQAPNAGVQAALEALPAYLRW